MDIGTRPLCVKCKEKPRAYAYKKGKKDTIVSSHIEHETAPPLRIDWRLRDRGEGTKIIDIAIEGVSLLATKRADFGASIKKGGLLFL